MNSLSPALIDALGLLTEDLYAHLHEAAYLADQDSEWSPDDMNRARGLISDLVLVLRGLLVEHRLRTGGGCGVCMSTWPCPVVTTIHAVVKDPERQFFALVDRSRED
jgi:hypothetical protein